MSFDEDAMRDQGAIAAASSRSANNPPRLRGLTALADRALSLRIPTTSRFQHVPVAFRAKRVAIIMRKNNLALHAFMLSAIHAMRF